MGIIQQAMYREERQVFFAVNGPRICFCLIFVALELKSESTMLFDDVIYQKFGDFVIGATERLANEDIDAANEEGGNVVDSGSKPQRIMRLLQEEFLISYQEEPFVNIGPRNRYSISVFGV